MNDPTPSNGVSRRAFFQLSLGWLAGLFAFGASAVAAVRFLVPNVLFEPSEQFKANKPEDYLDGSVTFLEDERVFLIRKGNTFRCLSAVCTHLGCTVQYEPQADRIHCACHGGVYNPYTGANVSGPPPKPLTLYKVAVSDVGVQVSRA